MGNIILLASMLLPVLIAGLALLSHRAWDRRNRRRSPLTSKLLNQPGDGIRQRMEKHDEAFAEALAGVVAVGPVFLAAWLMVRVDRAVPDWSQMRYGWGDLILFAAAAVMLGWTVRSLVVHARERRKYQDGLTAEIAVAQSLNRLMGQGAVVFHDFPADKFNIDHIVVGRGAVFAIETKSRRKPAEKGRESARVIYDGKRLQFPTHAEEAPLGQAARQAKWLEDFLGRGVGEPVRVIPVVALPGWYVETKAQRPPVLVSNCHNPNFMASESFGAAYSPAMRSRIAHVLAERYPGLPEP